MQDPTTRLPSIAEPCLGSLVTMLSCGCDATIATAIESIRRLLMSPALPPQPRVVTALALLLPAVVSVGASASCIGLVGAFWGELCTNYVAAHGSLEGARIGTLAAFTAMSLVTGVSPVVAKFNKSAAAEM
mgnify:CR=1 FL=1